MNNELDLSKNISCKKIDDTSRNHSYITLSLLAVPFFLGSSYAVAKIGMREIEPLNLAILRLGIASIIFSIILCRMKYNNKIDVVDIPRFILLGFMAITSFFYIHFLGLRHTTSTNAGLIMALSPIFAAVFCTLLKQEKVNWQALVGIISAFCGVTFVITQGDFKGIFVEKHFFGDALILSNSLVWAGITVYGSKLLEKYRPFIAMAYIHIFGTILLLPFAFIPSFFVNTILINQIATISWRTIASVLYLAIFCSVYSYYTWYKGVEILGAVRTAVFNYFNPVVAVLTGVFLFGEGLSMQTILGGMLAIMGVYVTNKCTGNADYKMKDNSS